MVVDRSALVAILLGEPEGDALALALAGAEMPVICAPNWLEAMMVISARLGRPGVQALGELLHSTPPKCRSNPLTRTWCKQPSTPGNASAKGAIRPA